MVTILFLFFFFFSISRAKKAIKRARSKARYKPPETAKVNHAALSSLQQQRDIIRDMITDIDAILDNAPPEKIRLQYLNKQAMLYSKMSTIESKIHKITVG